MWSPVIGEVESSRLEEEEAEASASDVEVGDRRLRRDELGDAGDDNRTLFGGRAVGLSSGSDVLGEWGLSPCVEERRSGVAAGGERMEKWWREG